jgi:Heterokaryon incompatibility protein (HET)
MSLLHSLQGTENGLPESVRSASALNSGLRRLCMHCCNLNFEELFFGDPRKRVVYLDDGTPTLDHTAAYLGSLQDVRQRAATGCDLCTLMLDKRIFEVYGCSREEVIDALESGLDTPPCRVYIAIRILGRTLTALDNDWGNPYPLKLYALLLFHDYQLTSLPSITSRSRVIPHYIELLDHPRTMKKAIAPKGDFRVFREWLHICLNEHSTCSRKIDIPAVPQSKFVRLASPSSPDQHCHPKETSPRVRLIQISRRMIVEIESLESVNYATLSYVWGSSKDQIRLRKHDVEPRDGYPSPWKYPEIPYGILPHTIRDAMSVAAEMGLDYLWVDALCIIQDDHVDLEVQIGSMARIYTNAMLCIIAATDESLNSGIRGVSVPRESAIQRVTNVTPGLVIGIIQTDIYGILSQAKWATRGWTYQEHMLSRRSLIFTNSEILFHCGTETYREYSSSIWREVSFLNWGDSDSIGDQSSIATTYLRHMVGMPEEGTLYKRESFLSDYERCVMEYSRRELSYDSDALNAFAGMIGLWSRYMRTEMVYGHPQSIFLESLFWSPIRKWGAEVALRRRLTSESLPSSQMVTEPPFLSIETSARPLFPSWSWAAWEGGVKFHAFGGELSVPDSVMLPLGPTTYSDLEFEGFASEFALVIRNGRRMLAGIVPLFTNVADFNIDTEDVQTLTHYFHGNVNIRNSIGRRVGVLNLAQNQIQKVPFVGRFILLSIIGTSWYTIMYVDLVEYDLAADHVAGDNTVRADSHCSTIATADGVVNAMVNTAAAFSDLEHSTSNSINIRTLIQNSVCPTWLARRIGVGVIEAKAWKESEPQNSLILLG